MVACATRVMATLTLIGGLACVAYERQSADPADLVLLNGKILTVDATDTVAQAVAVTAGKIVAVGSNDDIRARVGNETRVIELHGRTATPGMIDSHTHFSAADELYSIDLSRATSVADVLERVAARVKEAVPNQWILGDGWDEGKLAERRYITAADLDTVAANIPVYLTHTTGHYGTANGTAMKIGGITNTTKNPPFGTIDRDARGNATGVLKEAAQSLVRSKIPPLTREQEKAGILKIIEAFNKEGMTGVKDPGISQSKWDLYQEILNEGKLSVRVFVLWRERTLEGVKAAIPRLTQLPRPPASLGDGMLLSGGVKLAIDGSGGARTAWMYEDWNKDFTDKDTGNKGYPVFNPDQYREAVKLLHGAGIHVSTHAIGDRGIDWVVDSYDQALAATPTRGLRHGVIHANVPTDHAIDVMARLQREFDAGYPEAQGTFLWWIGDNYAANLGPQRSRRLKPFKTYVDRGIKWAGGSDYGVTPFPARYSLWASVARKTLNATHGLQPFGTQEAVDIRSALRAQTIWAAHQMFLDDRIGSIEVGKEADIAVWDRDIYAVDTDEIKDMKAELTLVKGKIVVHDPASPVTVSKTRLTN
jgi:predicted amidohydrolase YtcJ